MRNRRRNWLLRRLVLGLAVAAIAAPTALAGLDEGGTARSDGGTTAVIKGDDKVLAVGGGGLLVKGDDKVFAPAPRSDGVLVKGDDKVIPTVSEPIQVGRPAGRQVPIAATGTGTSDFNWGDALIGAAAALGLALLAYGAVRSTRGMSRPATT